MTDDGRLMTPGEMQRMADWCFARARWHIAQAKQRKANGQKAYHVCSDVDQARGRNRMGLQYRRWKREHYPARIVQTSMFEVMA